MPDDIQPPYKVDPPHWRTIVSGFWSDLLDIFLASFETTDRGGVGLGVFIQDQTTGVLDVPFLLAESAPTLAADTVIGLRVVTLATGHGLTTLADNGKLLEVADVNNGSFFMQSQIILVTGDDVLLDSPVNRIYKISESILSVSTQDINVDGSGTPQVFSILPFDLQKGDIVRIMPEIWDNVDMNFSTFGGLPALTNGIVIRVNNGDGTYRNLYNFKTNGDIIKQGFDHEFFPNNGNGVRSFASRLTWGGQSKRGVVVRLEGNRGESLELIVQDDLTGLLRHHWTGNGSEIQE